MWNDNEYLAFDFETSGELPEYALQPWRLAQGSAWATSFVWSASVDGKTRLHGGLSPTVDTMREMLEFAIAEKRTIIGWNTAFDISWLIAYGLEDLVMQCSWLDGLLLWRHLDIEPEYHITDRFKKRSYSLKNAVAVFLPKYAGYEEGVDFHSTDPDDLARLHKYNERDVLFTAAITKALYERLERNDPRQLNAALIEARCLPMIAKANLDGMPVDVGHTTQLAENLDMAADALLEELEPHGVTEKVIRSPIQLSKLIFDEWGLPVQKENVSKKTGNRSRSTDKEVLHELSFIDNRVAKLRSYREALNNKTKFASAPLISAEYNGDGNTHPSAIVFGTYSGRLTYASKQGRNKDARQTGFALHQMKRAAEFRSVIRAPEGYTLMEFDAAGQEFRWMAIASNDETMLSLCQPGEDPHGFMGARIASKDYREVVAAVRAGDKDAKNKRQLGKVANLSLQYRTSAKKLRVVSRVQYGMDMSLPDAVHIHATYRASYPQVGQYWGRQISMTRQSGYVETFAGRRVKVVGEWDGDYGWSMGSTAINYRIQGTGADQKYLAMSLLRDYLPSVGGRFGWDLHDGIYMFIPTDKVEKAAHEIRALLDNMPYKKVWGFTPPIPLPWDCKHGSNWGDLEEYDFG